MASTATATISTRMRHQEIDKLRDLAHRRGMTLSSYLAEIAQAQLRRDAA